MEGKIPPFPWHWHDLNFAAGEYSVSCHPAMAEHTIMKLCYTLRNV